MLSISVSMISHNGYMDYACTSPNLNKIALELFKGFFVCVYEKRSYIVSLFYILSHLSWGRSVYIACISTTRARNPKQIGFFISKQTNHSTNTFCWLWISSHSLVAVGDVIEFVGFYMKNSIWNCTYSGSLLCLLIQSD